MSDDANDRREIEELRKQMTRIEVKIDTLGLTLMGSKYVTTWDDANWHNARGMR